MVCDHGAVKSDEWDTKSYNILRSRPSCTADTSKRMGNGWALLPLDTVCLSQPRGRYDWEGHQLDETESRRLLSCAYCSISCLDAGREWVEVDELCLFYCFLCVAVSICVICCLCETYIDAGCLVLVACYHHTLLLESKRTLTEKN